MHVLEEHRCMRGHMCILEEHRGMCSRSTGACGATAWPTAIMVQQGWPCSRAMQQRWHSLAGHSAGMAVKHDGAAGGGHWRGKGGICCMAPGCTLRMGRPNVAAPRVYLRLDSLQVQLAQPWAAAVPLHHTLHVCP